MDEAAVFIPSGGRFVATKLARGPWDPGALHGGAPAALLMRAFEATGEAEGLSIARVTYEFLRPVPLAELSLRAEVIRPGRRVELLEGSIFDPEGVEVVRARALRLAAASADGYSSPPATPPAGPETATAAGKPTWLRPMFTPDAVEIRFLNGRFGGGGPATAWFRLHAPLVSGETPTPLQRLAAAGDFGNGISADLSWDDYVFINPDLTLYIERPPVGEWVCLDSETVIAPGGVATAESVMYDTEGRVGRAVQSLLVAPRSR